MDEEQRKRLEAKSRIGKTVWFKDKQTGQRIRWGIVEDEVYIMVSDYKHMIQKIRHPKSAYWDGSKFGYRTGYYTYDKNMKNIIWGQFTQFLTEREYKRLLDKAQKKDWSII